MDKVHFDGLALIYNAADDPLINDLVNEKKGKQKHIKFHLLCFCIVKLLIEGEVFYDDLAFCVTNLHRCIVSGLRFYMRLIVIRKILK